MRFVSPISAVCVLSVSAYFTQAHAQTHTFNISAHTFSDALAAFQKQSGLSVLANTEDTRHLSGPYVVSGKMSDVEALKQLVKKGSFTVHQSSPRTLVIEKAQFPKGHAKHVYAGGEEEIVATGRQTRSVMTVGGEQMQATMPGQNPLQALSILPGVTFTNVDPWGNNEQNSSIYVHGFSTTQLGYTLDGIPLGAGAYGNYNGLSPQRAAISEDISKVALSSGTGALGTASSSNLGGTSDFTTADPKKKARARIKQIFGSYNTFRTFARVDTGNFGNNNSAYFAFSRQDARAWNLNGANRQGGYQVNAKFLHKGEKTKITAYFDWQNKSEPNTQGLSINSNDWLTDPTKQYTRGAFYPDLAAAMANYPSMSSTSKAPAAPNNQYYFSSAQRTDFLTYLKISHRFNSHLTWDNNLYFHYDDGAGVVATSIRTNAILTILGTYLDPSASKYIKNGQFTYSQKGIDPKVWNKTGGTGFATRTTEYTDYRGGLTSTFHYRVGHHNIETGIWYERNNNEAARRWYALSATNTLTPYQTPKDPLFTQWQNKFYTDTFVFHVQDTWKVLPNLTVMAGMKLEQVNTNGTLPVAALPQSLATNTTGSKTLDSNTQTAAGGTISAFKPFLPAVGMVWDFTRHEQVFVNIQKNMNSFAESGYGTTSPWGVSSQAEFEDFKKHGKPETSWTYEAGLRTFRPINSKFLDSISGQLEYYHVNFYDRLGAIKKPDAGISGVGTTIANLGDVTTDGVDLSFTLKFNQHFSLYDAVSYIKSRYDNNFTDGTDLYLAKNKTVPGIPVWSDKFVLRYNVGAFQTQVNGEWMAQRPGTYTNTLYAPPRFTMGYSARYSFYNIPHVNNLTLQFNIYNLTNARTWSSLAVGDTTSYTAYPMTPRTFYGTVSASF